MRIRSYVGSIDRIGSYYFRTLVVPCMIQTCESMEDSVEGGETTGVRKNRICCHWFCRVDAYQDCVPTNKRKEKNKVARKPKLVGVRACNTQVIT